MNTFDGAIIILGVVAFFAGLAGSIIAETSLEVTQANLKMDDVTSELEIMGRLFRMVSLLGCAVIVASVWGM